MFSPRTPPSLRSDERNSIIRKFKAKKMSLGGHRKANKENDMEIHCNSTEYNYIY